MKKIICAAAAFMLVFLCGCAGTEKLSVTNCEIVFSGEEKVSKFTVENNTGKTISNLTVLIKMFDSAGKETDSAEAGYPINVKSGESATVTAKSGRDYDYSKAVSCTYTLEGEAEKTLVFKKEYTARYENKTEGPGSIKTRADVAEEMIQDVKIQFLKKKYMTDGSYDPEKKQLMIASYCDMTLKECKASYQINPDQWDELSQSMASMCQTCVDEFKSYGFDDVHVSLGFMSKDEEIIISATDGEIVDTLS